ncbi:MAG TPA: ATP-binding protein [Frankiaceae bacterium]|nr:ATP-binding protein [Frankiaceae bacterium]
MRSRRPWSLRVRLLVALISLLAVVCVVVGIATELALRSFLVGRLDDQLQAAGQRSATAFRGPGDDETGRPRPAGLPERGGVDFLTAPGQAAGTLGARVANGQLMQVAVLSTSGIAQPIDPTSAAALVAVPADGKPHSRSLGDLGDYRLQVQRTDDGDLLVTGLPLNGVRLTLLRLAAVEGAVAVIALFSAGLVGATIVRRTLRPLDRVAATAGRVANLQLDRGDVALAERVSAPDTDPRTEAGRVGAALNRLLNHVDAALTSRQASEMRVRQFVADASHELRTPLAAIRGYAELTRRSGSQAPPDVVYALGRVESEAARMTTLVEDLLLLARLDAGRPLASDAVDLTSLAVHAVSDAHVAGPDHQWNLDLPDEPVAVLGDEARLHQVIANLLANARTHTPEGTRVTVAIAREGAGTDERVVLTVSDTGPGIPAELLPDVFQRFARGDGSRSRTAGSTGLGLAIVAAVVTAHGGEVAVSSVPGATTFRVSLPSAPGTTAARPAAAATSAAAL